MRTEWTATMADMASMREGVSLAVSTIIFALRPDPATGRSVVSLPLVRRTREPFADRWALPGGWAQAGEGLEVTALRTLSLIHI